MRLTVAVTMLLGSFASIAAAQMPLPRSEDVSTIDGIIAAFYDVVSGPAGTPRQWHRDSTLYIPNARFVASPSASATSSTCSARTRTAPRHTAPSRVVE